MATIYICKCGRRVRKSTNADNTGNRDTAGCRGCPYLLPWGPTEWTGKGFEQNIQGHECRMSPEISYATDYSGSANDKCTLKIHSLDLDFLEDIQAWIDEYADGQLSGRFSRDTIRGTDYCNKGRYSWSISCAQNKKGIAAKAALLHQFFDASGARLDKTPEEEKAIVLAAIEAGKAKVKTQERKKTMDYIISKHEATARLYAYYKGVFWFWDEHVQKWLISQFAEDLYQEERPKRRNFEREHFLAQTSDFHQLDDYEVPSRCIEALLQCNPKAAKKENLIDSPCASSEAGEDTNVPTSSAAATAAAEETAATPEPSDSASMTAAPVAKASEPAGVAAENALAGADGSTVFDYSGLDTTTVDTLHVAERIIRTARQKYIVDMAGAVSMVHGELVRNSDEHNNQHTEDTFIAWCRFMGISKTTAYQLLQVQSLISGATAEEQATLESASPSLLYAAAKPSAPAELVQAVKDGDITTHKQFKELEAKLKAEREARVKAQQDLETVERARDAEHEANSALLADEQRRRQAADEARIAAEKKVQQYREIKDAALENVKMEQEKAVNAELRARAAEEDAAEKDKRIRELETGRPQTIEATVVERIRMPEMAEEDAAELTTNLAASVTTVQRSFFMAAAAMAPQVKARCANTLWDTVNELATLLAASANPSYEEEEATPFD